MNLRQRLDGLDNGNEVRLHVGRAAGVDQAVTERRLEWRRLPQLERVGRLDVIVTVDEDRGLAGSGVPGAVYNRVAWCFDQADVGHACRSQAISDPVGAF